MLYPHNYNLRNHFRTHSQLVLEIPDPLPMSYSSNFIMTHFSLYGAIYHHFHIRNIYDDYTDGAI